MTSKQTSALLRHLHRMDGTPAVKRLTDAQLLQRFTLHHADDAFAALVQRHGRLVWGVCQHLLHREHDAEDAFQATFLVQARKAAAIRQGDSVGSWLYGVAYRVARRARTRAAKRKERERQAGARARGPAGSELAWRELQALLDEEVQRLPEKYRAAFVLCCLETRSRRDAAAELGLKEGTLSSRIALARRLLQARLARRGVGLSAALTAGELWGQTAAAAVPAALGKATVRAVAGQGGALTTMSASALALAEGAMKSGTARLAAVLVPLALGLLTIGAGAMTDRDLAAPPVEPRHQEKPQAATRDEGLLRVRTDLQNDPLPPRAVARLGTVRLRHAGQVNSTAFSPDGKILATGGGDERIRLWDVATGRELREINLAQKGHANGVWVYSVAFSRDGKTLAAGSSEMEVGLWEVATGKELWRLKGISRFVVISPDGRTLATGGFDDRIRLREAATGKDLRFLFPAQRINQPQNIYGVAFSPDSKTLAAAGQDKVIRLWDVATGKEVHQLPGHQEEVKSVAFSPDGKWLASASVDKTVRLWDVATGKERRQLGKRPFVFQAVAFSPNGKTLAAGGWGKSAFLWDAATGKEIGRFSARVLSIDCLAFSKDGKKLAAGSYCQTIHLWDVATRKEIHQFGGHRGGVNGVAFAPDGRTLATASWDQTVRLWEVAAGKEVGQCQGHEAGVRCVAFAPDGKTLASGSDNTIRLWKASTGKEIQRIATPQNVAFCVVFSPNGRQLAAATGDGTVHVFETASGKRVRELAGHEGPAYTVAFSPDGQTLASGGLDKSIRLWNVATGKLVRQLTGHQGWVMASAFSPDGGTLASAGGHDDSTVRLWEAATGKEIRQFTGHEAGIHGLAFSADGRTLASTGWDRTIRLWEVATGKERCRFEGQAFLVTSVALSPDGRLLASGGQDTTAVLWDVTGRLKEGRQPLVCLSSKDLAAHWATLAGADAAQAHRALWVLVSAPQQTLPFLSASLRPAASVAPPRIVRLIADLDSNRFVARKKAAQELEKLIEQAEPALRKALAGSPSAEARRLMEHLLENLAPARSLERLRALRAVEVLEYIGTTEARKQLMALARGAAEARLTREAKAALERLDRRP